MKLTNPTEIAEAKQWLDGVDEDDLIALYIDWKKIDRHFKAELKAVENDHKRIAQLEAENEKLIEYKTLVNLINKNKIVYEDNHTGDGIIAFDDVELATGVVNLAETLAVDKK